LRENPKKEKTRDHKRIGNTTKENIQHAAVIRALHLFLLELFQSLTLYAFVFISPFNASIDTTSRLHQIAGLTASFACVKITLGI